MKQDLVVGIIVFCLVLAAASVGVSTFIARQDLANVQEEVRILAATQPPPQPVQQSPDTLPKLKPVADSLVSNNLLWTRGRMLVSDAATKTPHQLFNVDPAIGTRVETTLTVVHQSVLATVSANGRVTATGLMKAASFENGGASFVADSGGNVRLSSLVAGAFSRFNAGLAVVGPFQVGDAKASKRILWDPVKGILTVTGNVVASVFGDGQSTRILGEVRPDSIRTNSGDASIDAAGNLRAVSIEASSGVTTWGPVTADGFRSLTSGKFLVDPLGNTTVGGTLWVGGPAIFNGPVGAYGTVSARSLSVTADAKVRGSVTVTGKLLASNIWGGVVTVSGGAGSMNVPSMPATAGVTVTPRFNPTQQAYVTVEAGTFTVHSSDNGDFSWVAIWQ